MIQIIKDYSHFSTIMKPGESHSMMDPLAHSDRFEDFRYHSFSAINKTPHRRHESYHHHSHHHHDGSRRERQGLSHFPRSRNIPITSQRNNTSSEKVPKKRLTGDVLVDRSSSELRLQEELEMADFRDYVFFARLVEGISQRQEFLQKQRGSTGYCANEHENFIDSLCNKAPKTASSARKNLKWQRQNDLCLARIIRTRNGWIDQNHHHRHLKESRNDVEFDDEQEYERNLPEEEGTPEEMFLLDM